jgi:signal transduction histidine kinase
MDAASNDDGRLHILIVEDEPAHAELMRIVFSRHGRHCVVISPDIASARQSIATGSPDIVIADLSLPDGQGTDLVSGFPHQADYPLVLLTSHGDEQIAVDAMKSGIRDYLVKSDAVFTELPGIAERAVREWHEVRRREAEKALMHVSRLATMGELIAGISHEVNQPLFAVKNLSQACRKILDQDQPDMAFLSQCVNDISVAADWAGEVVHRLKRFIRNQESERREADITELVEETVDLLKFELARSHVVLQVESPETSPVIHVDRIQIQQVLVNLIKNAIEAIDESNATVREIAVRIDSQTEHIFVSVSDTGPGIPADVEDVFAAFSTTKTEGMGMGLAISQTITAAHGGQLTHDNPVSGGAKFTLRLPVASRRQSEF